MCADLAQVVTISNGNRVALINMGKNSYPVSTGQAAVSLPYVCNWHEGAVFAGSLHARFAIRGGPI
jgi:hypothetical protein